MGNARSERMPDVYAYGLGCDLIINRKRNVRKKQRTSAKSSPASAGVRKCSAEVLEMINNLMIAGDCKEIGTGF